MSCDHPPVRGIALARRQSLSSARKRGLLSRAHPPIPPRGGRSSAALGSLARASVCARERPPGERVELETPVPGEDPWAVIAYRHPTSLKPYGRIPNSQKPNEELTPEGGMGPPRAKVPSHTAGNYRHKRLSLFPLSENSGPDRGLGGVCHTPIAGIRGTGIVIASPKGTSRSVHVPSPSRQMPHMRMGSCPKGLTYVK